MHCVALEETGLERRSRQADTHCVAPPTGESIHRSRQAERTPRSHDGDDDETRRGAHAYTGCVRLGQKTSRDDREEDGGVFVGSRLARRGRGGPTWISRDPEAAVSGPAFAVDSHGAGNGNVQCQAAIRKSTCIGRRMQCILEWASEASRRRSVFSA